MAPLDVLDTLVAHTDAYILTLIGLFAIITGPMVMPVLSTLARFALMAMRLAVKFVCRFGIHWAKERAIEIAIAALLALLATFAPTLAERLHALATAVM